MNVPPAGQQGQYSMPQYPYENSPIPYNQYPQGNPFGNAQYYSHAPMPINPNINLGTMDSDQMKEFCKKYQDYFVLVDMNDGQQYDGIVDRIDDHNIYLLVPSGENDDDRELLFGGYGDNLGYGYGYGYGGGYGGGYGYPRRFRRFRRYRFPLARILRLLLYPYFY